jgi:hypothetical protein
VVVRQTPRRIYLGGTTVTDPEIDTTITEPEDVPPMSSEEAAEVVENDQVLQEAGADEPDEA